MSDEDRDKQQALHDKIAEIAEENGLILTWIVIWETESMNEANRAQIGHLYGPREMKTWKAIGLVEYASRYTLVPDDNDDDS